MSGDAPRRRARGMRPKQEDGLPTKGTKHLHLDVVFDDAHRVGLDVFIDRRALTFAGLHVEATAMQRAFDDVAIEKAIGQHRKGMGAGIVGRIELAVHVVDRDHVITDLDPQHRAVAERRTRPHRDPFRFRHCASFSADRSDVRHSSLPNTAHLFANLSRPELCAAVPHGRAGSPAALRRQTAASIAVRPHIPCGRS